MSAGPVGWAAFGVARPWSTTEVPSPRLLCSGQRAEPKSDMAPNQPDWFLHANRFSFVSAQIRAESAASWHQAPSSSRPTRVDPISAVDQTFAVPLPDPPGEFYSVRKNAISCSRSSAVNLRPNSWPLIARVTAPGGLKPPGTWVAKSRSGSNISSRLAAAPSCR